MRPRHPHFLTKTLMKNLFYSVAVISCAGLMVACSGAKEVALGVSTQFQGAQSKTVNLTKDKEGYITLFDGTSLEGWRGYGKDHVPARWTIEDGCLKFSEGQGEGGDIIFAHKFKNFILEVDWKISKGGNSGIFYLAQEAKGVNDKGEEYLEPIYVSAPEYQLLDNENHPDAKMGVDGNRKSGSLYDMLPAKPQNCKPYGEWNSVKIVVDNGTVTHYQNGAQVVQYKLWTPEWTQLLQNSKFSEKAWPSAFKLLDNCGGANHEGLIGFQDHGNTLWLRNIRVKELK